MRSAAPSRLVSLALQALRIVPPQALLLLMLGPHTVVAQIRGHGAPPTAHGAPTNGRPMGRPGGEHLPQWLNQHSTLSPPEQQRALEREPGFRELAPQMQQRMRDRLSELNHMPPQQRQRILARAEAMERLSPDQRQRIRGSMQQLSSLPQDQRKAVREAFRQYRGLDAVQRQSALNSGQLTNSLSPEQRATFNGLVSVEPYLPMPAPRQPVGEESYPEPGQPGFQPPARSR